MEIKRYKERGKIKNTIQKKEIHDLNITISEI